MPSNKADLPLRNSVYLAVREGNQTLNSIRDQVDRPRMSVYRALQDLVKLGMLGVATEYREHRYYCLEGSEAKVVSLEYVLPKIDEYRAQKVPQLVKISMDHIQSGRTDPRDFTYQRTCFYALLALAAHSEDPKHLSKLCQAITERLSSPYADYRLFDTIRKRGIDKTRAAKDLFDIGDESPHQAATYFDELFEKVFGSSST